MSTPIPASGSIQALNPTGAPSVAAFGGRIPTTTSYIKQFYDTASQDTWYYGNKLGQPILTPINQLPSLDVYIPGNLIVQGTFLNPSDLSFKENIHGIQKKIYDNLLKIEPKCYSLKDDVKKKQHYGIIAQELESLFPELIEEKNSKKHIQYLELIPLLIGKMKQMQEEIDELRRLITKDN
jgi:hypothetical protein